MIFNQKEHSHEICYALYRIILEHVENTVAHFTMEFVLLISVHQFHLLFVSLVIKLDSFHHLRLHGKQGVTATIENALSVS